ncbi:MAG: hypothetical protein M0C28_26650 [Candidatus Moduliflexus flocculans]|nr:hypothetical protein [Candidatus Moduliflexus flocculans]
MALSLRESGRAKRDRDGNIVKDARGNTVKVPGRFKEVKSVGWYVEDYGLAQISVNFTNYKVTPIHTVFDEAVRLAAKLGLRVTGSELVGLIPKEALLMAGRHYLGSRARAPACPKPSSSGPRSGPSGSATSSPSSPARRSSNTSSAKAAPLSSA